MPVPTVITDLSTTAGSNSPAGTDNIGTNADDYLRALSAFIAQVRDGSKNLELGTATAPSLAFTGDTNTGIYSAAADKVNITTGGANRVQVDSSGLAVTGNSSATGILLSGGTGQFGYASFARTTDGASYWLAGSAASGGNPDFRIYNNSVGGAAITIIGTTNHILKPYQPYFRAYSSATRTTSGTFTTYTEIDDVGGCFNNTTGVFTAPVAGKYLITAKAQIIVDATGNATALIQPSVEVYCDIVRANNVGGVAFVGASGTATIMNLAASETVTCDLSVSQANVTSAVINDFSAMLLG